MLAALSIEQAAPQRSKDASFQTCHWDLRGSGLRKLQSPTGETDDEASWLPSEGATIFSLTSADLLQENVKEQPPTSLRFGQEFVELFTRATLEVFFLRAHLWITKR